MTDGTDRMQSSAAGVQGWGNHGRSLSALPHVPDMASPLSSPHLPQNPNSKGTVTEDSSSAVALET